MAGKVWPVVVNVLLVVLLAAFAVVAFTMADPMGRVKGWITGEGPSVSSGDSTLLTIKETAELNAATGTYSVPVFLEPDNNSLLGKLPGVISGDKVVAIYQGEVRAVVDLQGLTEGDIEANEETKTLKLTVPEPVLTEPQIDPDASQVVMHNRGVLTRLEDALGDSELDLKNDLDEEARASLAQAAADSDLKQTGKENAEKFLASIGKSMGYDTVEVEFATSPI